MAGLPLHMSHCEAASHASKSEHAQLLQHRSSAKTSVHFTRAHTIKQSEYQSNKVPEEQQTNQPTNQPNKPTDTPTFLHSPPHSRLHKQTNKQTNRQQTNILCFSACGSLGSNMPAAYTSQQAMNQECTSFVHAHYVAF
jgi:hypothetical protein